MKPTAHQTDQQPSRWILYHGTSSRRLKHILDENLLRVSPTGGDKALVAPDHPRRRGPLRREGNDMSAPEKAALGVGPTHFVTVATAADRKLMTKIFSVDSGGREQTRSYDKGYLFSFSTPAVGCLDS
jgi:hypothetical protein